VCRSGRGFPLSIMLPSDQLNLPSYSVSGWRRQARITAGMFMFAWGLLLIRQFAINLAVPVAVLLYWWTNSPSFHLFLLYTTYHNTAFRQVPFLALMLLGRGTHGRNIRYSFSRVTTILVCCCILR